MVEMPETQTVAVATAGSSDSSGGVREADGLGLGLPQKMARTETFPFRMVPSHLFQSNSVGPTFYNGNDRSRLSDLYDVGGTATVAAVAAGAARVLQPFPFKSPGVGGMAAALRFPFTSAQWQELERQALIYKYMIASIPVPPELLFPINRRNCNSFSEAAAARADLVGRGSPYINLRFSNGSDLEPTRCRRTDGKKWRCSRDVAPDQKYCERHMHRGRPRSRKPVEVEDQKHHNRPTTVATAATAAVPATNATAPLCNLTTTTTAAASSHNQTSGFFGKPEIKLPFQTMAAVTEPRFLDQMASNQQWELMHPKVGVRVDCSGSTNGPAFQLYDDHLNLNFTNFGNVASGLQQNDQCCLFLNTDLSSLEDPDADRRSPPRHFIDAWSVGGREDLNTDNPNNDNSEKSPISSGGELAISSLTLSMSGDMDQIHMGLGISDSERDNVSVKSHPLSWMSSVPWQSPPSLGGPLGEVLQSSTVAGSNSASSPHGCSSSRSSCGGLNLMSDGWVEPASPRDRPPLKLDSSPTRVLQKTLASLSDCSSSSSPTFAAAKSEIALQWLSQSKFSSS